MYIQELIRSHIENNDEYSKFYESCKPLQETIEGVLSLNDEDGIIRSLVEKLIGAYRVIEDDIELLHAAQSMHQHRIDSLKRIKDSNISEEGKQKMMDIFLNS